LPFVAFRRRMVGREGLEPSLAVYTWLALSRGNPAFPLEWLPFLTYDLGEILSPKNPFKVLVL